PVSFQEVVIEGVVDEWYHFNVVVTWQEPNDGLNALHEIELHAAMVPANL
ncbi:hypothetical protein H8D57_00180, partial [bacterium]|nr:hypothetical protein [bacterium]